VSGSRSPAGLLPSATGPGAFVLDFVLGAVAALVSRVPFRFLRALGSPLGWVVGSLLRVRRRHVEASLRRSGCPSPRSSARAMYASLGASVMELLWLARRPTAALSRVCALDRSSRRLLEDVLAKGRGVVLAASHTGNWELAACAMARELDLLVVVKPIATAGVDAFMTRARRAHGIGLAPPDGALLRARQVLDRRGCVAMLIDQVPGQESHGMELDFLGGRALADRAPASLAASAGAPLVVVAFRRAASGAHVIEVLRVAHPPERDRRAWVLRATREATLALDAFVRRYPSEWLWMHRRWHAPRCATRPPPRLPEGVACAIPAPARELEERHA
jgi:KDO2-lipid IV(A) lauroyltransferase